MRLEDTTVEEKLNTLPLNRLYGAHWRGVAYDAERMFAYEPEPHEPGAHFFFLLAYDTEGNEVGRERIGGRREWVNDGPV